MKSYNPKGVFFTINGVQIRGFVEDTMIDCEWGADLLEKTVGADGETVYSASADRSIDIEFELLETSLAYKRCMSLVDAQVAAVDAGGAVPDVAIGFRDFINGDAIGGRGVFMSRPAPSKGRTVSGRKFKISMPFANVAAGSLITS